MKQLLVLSGKGGTGKTTLASALIAIMEIEAFADADVDAPNLHLTQSFPPPTQEEAYYGMNKAIIDETQCTQCGLCQNACRFDAIKEYKVNAYACEGCALCAHICPVSAIKMQPNVAGYRTLYKDERVFSTANLKMGQGNSGLLVTEVKKALKPYSETYPYAIIDGSPGIGCPVIASISGVDYVLMVSEPSVSGLHDLSRVVKTTRKLGVPMMVCVNKYDVHLGNTQKIIDYCKEQVIPYVGSIPYDSRRMTDDKSTYSIAVHQLSENIKQMTK